MLGLVIALVGCAAQAGDPPNDFAPDTVDEVPEKYGLPEIPDTYNCIAWPVRMGNLGAITMRTGAGVVACKRPEAQK